MEVILKRPWFAPFEGEVNGRVMGGRRYRKGRHTLPNDLLPFLPKSAEIVDRAAEPEPEKTTSAAEARAELHALDESRALAESGPELEAEDDDAEVAAAREKFQREIAQQRKPGRPRKS